MDRRGGWRLQCVVYSSRELNNEIDDILTGKGRWQKTSCTSIYLSIIPEQCLALRLLIIRTTVLIYGWTHVICLRVLLAECSQQFLAIYYLCTSNLVIIYIFSVSYPLPPAYKYVISLKLLIDIISKLSSIPSSMFNFSELVANKNNSVLKDDDPQGGTLF